MTKRKQKREPYTSPYTPEEILTIWGKGQVVLGREPSEWREDDFGNRIQFDKYGDRDSSFGWEVDHIISIKDGGSNLLSNLRPIQWETNVKRN